MNVTNKPLNQLAIMQKRVKQNRPIKDCAKLLQDPKFWFSACENMLNFDRDQFAVIEQLRAVLTTPLQFTQLTREQSSLVTEACLSFINAVFVAEEFFQAKQTSLKEQLDQLKRDWLNVNWVITITVTSKCDTELDHYLSHLIADEPFRSLLKQVLKKLQHDNHPRYQNLARTIYFSRQLRFVQNQSPHQAIIDENKLLLGNKSTKIQTKALYQELSSLTATCECYFSHFSQPFLFKNYAIKRNWKLKKINIELPQHMLIKLAHMFQYGDFHNGVAKPRGGLIHKPIPTIYSTYQKELDQIVSYFMYADNYHMLADLFSFAQQSLIKTIALKQGCTFGQATYLLKERRIQRFKLPKRRN